MKEIIKMKALVIFLLLVTLISCDEDDDDVKPSNPLVAVAGPDVATLANEVIELDGSKSYDKNNQTFSHQWTIKAKPAGSVVELVNANAERAIFSANVAGTYVVQLQVSRGNWKSMDDVSIVVRTNIDAREAVILSEPIVENTLLSDIFTDPSKVDYVVTNDILVRANLQIAPGVVIAFERDKSLQILNGSFQALGTSTEPIVFKGNGSGTGFWKGILIYTSSDVNRLVYSVVQQGGSKPFVETGVAGNIVVAGTPYSGGAIAMTNCTVSHSGGHGIYLQGASTLNSFSSNQFNNNAMAAAYIPAQHLHKVDELNSAASNGFDGIETSGTISEGPVTWSKRFNGVVRVTDNILINSPLNIMPGLTLAIAEGKSMTIMQFGRLQAIGTSNEKIQFIGASANAYWNGLIFNALSLNNVLEHCEISNAGLNPISEAEPAGNITLLPGASLTLKNSTVRNSLGYGVVRGSGSSINSDVLTSNTFDDLHLGNIYPVFPDDEKPALTGAWVDYNAFNRGATSITEDLYDRESNEWFGGKNPYTSNVNFGLLITEEGKFIWTAAQFFSSDCPSYTADYLTGNASMDASSITLDTEYWRSVSSSTCDPTQDVDTEVSPSGITLRYEINRMYNVLTGEGYWQLKIYQPDNSTSSYYRK